MEAEIARVWNRVSDHENRLRDVEQGRTDFQRRVLSETAAAAAKLAELDIHGTAITQERLSNIQATIARQERALEKLTASIETDHDERERDATANRRLVLGSLLAGAVSIASSLLVFLLTRGP